MSWVDPSPCVQQIWALAWNPRRWITTWPPGDFWGSLPDDDHFIHVFMQRNILFIFIYCIIYIYIYLLFIYIIYIVIYVYDIVIYIWSIYPFFLWVHKVCGSATRTSCQLICPTASLTADCMFQSLKSPDNVESLATSSCVGVNGVVMMPNKPVVGLKSLQQSTGKGSCKREVQ